MAAAWDERSEKEQRRLQNVLLRQSILQMALGHVPYVRAKLAAMGIEARDFRGLDQMHELPLTMRRDIVDPVRNPEGPRALILRGTADGVKRFSDRSVIRRVALARLFGGQEIQELAIEAVTRPIHVHMAPGPGGRLPVAYTRDDLDLLARAGSRLSALTGLERHDRLLNLVPFGPTLDFWGIFYMAHGTGVSVVHFRRDRQDLGRALEVFDDSAATAIALPADEAALFPDVARAERINLTALRAVIAVGRSLTADERTVLGEGLLSLGALDVRIAAAYGSAEGRVLWGECSVPAGRTETFGFHTFPDMEVLEIVSPETGEAIPDHQAGEIVVTPLGFRGGGVPRWRTGDLALGGITTEPCPNCGRRVPRVGPTVRRGAWQRVVALNGSKAWIDLRDAGAAASEHASDWQVELRRNGDGDRLFIYVNAPDEPGPVIDLYEDLKRLHSRPTQIVLADLAELAGRRGAAPGPWQRYWERLD
ncbi:MAG: phenylacetate--CoA ligase family protein [Actinomycetota bacterium]